jgi:hypothetical protein
MERFDDLYRVFSTENIRTLPDGIADIEFAEEFSHFLVDDTGDEEHEQERRGEQVEDAFDVAGVESGWKGRKVGGRVWRRHVFGPHRLRGWAS